MTECSTGFWESRTSQQMITYPDLLKYFLPILFLSMNIIYTSSLAVYSMNLSFRTSDVHRENACFLIMNDLVYAVVLSSLLTSLLLTVRCGPSPADLATSQLLFVSETIKQSAFQSYTTTATNTLHSVCFVGHTYFSQCIVFTVHGCGGQSVNIVFRSNSVRDYGC